MTLRVVAVVESRAYQLCLALGPVECLTRGNENDQPLKDAVKSEAAGSSYTPSGPYHGPRLPGWAEGNEVA